MLRPTGRGRGRLTVVGRPRRIGRARVDVRARTAVGPGAIVGFPGLAVASIATASTASPASAPGPGAGCTDPRRLWARQPRRQGRTALAAGCPRDSPPPLAAERPATPIPVAACPLTGTGHQPRRGQRFIVEHADLAFLANGGPCSPAPQNKREFELASSADQGRARASIAPCCGKCRCGNCAFASAAPHAQDLHQQRRQRERHGRAAGRALPGAAPGGVPLPRARRPAAGGGLAAGARGRDRPQRGLRSPAQPALPREPVLPARVDRGAGARAPGPRDLCSLYWLEEEGAEGAKHAPPDVPRLEGPVAARVRQIAADLADSPAVPREVTVARSRRATPSRCFTATSAERVLRNFDHARLPLHA